MDYGRLLHQLPDELRTFIRKYEALSKKLINNKWSTKFNEICLEEDILPNFTRIYIYIYVTGNSCNQEIREIPGRET